ncbi:hypothetical protein BJ165DRAFT_236912 [Panaeolus papilionaceus]|nr:hypothetical protein BJ165DRAFT_236912 [Panaeolus papilionaceus]
MRNNEMKTSTKKPAQHSTPRCRQPLACITRVYLLPFLISSLPASLHESLLSRSLYQLLSFPVSLSLSLFELLSDPPLPLFSDPPPATTSTTTLPSVSISIPLLLAPHLTPHTIIPTWHFQPRQQTPLVSLLRIQREPKPRHDRLCRSSFRRLGCRLLLHLPTRFRVCVSPTPKSNLLLLLSLLMFLQHQPRFHPRFPLHLMQRVTRPLFIHI